eukprot:Phypoly_transcript_02214.p1 GENE.Phypoly_transcript_02214~~Phypoly_transcript_02214.p1  ORF type:complete len:595 (+),score=96.98 Phypoly_transcript_02214:53-1837(+)
MRMDPSTLGPLSVVEDLFSQFLEANPSHEALKESANWGVADHFDKLLSEGDMLQKIPSINTVNPDQLPPNSVVKFRCMIQDMFDPEYYIGVYEQHDTVSKIKSKKTGKYADHINFQPNIEADMSPLSPSSITYERQPFLCVPIPGETKWVKDTIQANQSQSQTGPDEEGRANLKRSRDEEKPSQNGKTTLRSIDYVTDTACVVAVYDVPDGTLKLNDTLEVVGILAPHQPSTPSVDEDMLDVPSTVSTLPRIHCLTFRVIQNAHPLLGNSLKWKPIPNPASEPPQTPIPHPLEQALQDTARLREVRQQIISYLSTGLGGDNLAAEYLLLFLLSKVYQRHGLLAVGKLSLNFNTQKMNKQHDILAPVPVPPLATTIRNMCSSLVPRCGSHSLTLERLNRDNYIPKKDYTSNRLMPALLQLSEGTLLIIDESTLNVQTPFAGLAKANLAALNDLTQWQKLEYDFVYHKGEFLVDIPVLTISPRKPLLSVDCTVLIQSNTYAANIDPPADLVELWRVYLSMLRSKQVVPPGEEVTSHMENDFVQARQQNAAVTQDSFHLWLTLARLSAISFGEDRISIDRWGYIRRLDEARVQRETL